MKTETWMNAAKVAGLRRIKDARGLTEDELAKMVGIARPTISRVLRGETVLKTNLLSKLSRALHVAPMELLSDPLEEALEELRRASRKVAALRAVSHCRTPHAPTASATCATSRSTNLPAASCRKSAASAPPTTSPRSAAHAESADAVKREFRKLFPASTGAQRMTDKQRRQLARLTREWLRAIEVFRPANMGRPQGVVPGWRFPTQQAPLNTQA